MPAPGNGREFFWLQQGDPVTSVPWMLGGIGVAQWRGVRLADILDRAGITPDAVDVMPQGLDPDYATGGVDYGHVRRPVPVAKALDDVIVAYEMNGRLLPPDNGFPLRFICPSGRQEFLRAGVERSARRGPGLPAHRQVLVGQRAHRTHGSQHRRADLATRTAARTWPAACLAALGNPLAAARARLLHAALPRHRRHGRHGPDTVPFNTREYLFDAIVDHPVTVT
jgi:hypothetical protein